MSPLPQNPLELLSLMVSVESVNPDYGGPANGQVLLAETIEKIAKAWSLSTRRYAVGDRGLFNLVVSAGADPVAEWLLFESHLDTVSIAGMTVPALEVTTAGDRLHGRGTCDTKGSGAAMLWALHQYAQQPRRARNVGVVFAVDEEAGMTGAQGFAASGLKDFPRLRGIIVGEPTELRPVVAHNGALRWRSVTRGVAAHSADPSKGRSAITAMIEVIARLEREFIPAATAAHALTGRSAASINVIRGGSAVNIIPDHCEIHCDRRLVPGETVADVLAQRDAALRGLEVTHDSQYLAPPLPPENSAKLHAWIEPVIRQNGFNASAIGAPYATDASHYAAAGAPVLVLGPGNIAQAHTRDEWLAREQFDAAVALYRGMMELK